MSTQVAEFCFLKSYSFTRNILSNVYWDKYKTKTFGMQLQVYFGSPLFFVLVFVLSSTCCYICHVQKITQAIFTWFFTFLGEIVFSIEVRLIPNIKPKPSVCSFSHTFGSPLFFVLVFVPSSTCCYICHIQKITQAILTCFFNVSL